MTASPQMQRALELVVAAVSEFFQSTGVTNISMEQAGAKQVAVKSDQLFSSSLGFSGEGIKGALIVTTYSDALAATNPQREFLKAFTESDHADWIGEMSNQIVGNLKRHMAASGVDFTLATPVVVGGNGCKLLSPDNGKFVPLDFWVEGHKVKVYSSIVLSAGIDLVRGEDDADSHAAGGDAFLF